MDKEKVIFALLFATFTAVMIFGTLLYLQQQKTLDYFMIYAVSNNNYESKALEDLTTKKKIAPIGLTEEKDNFGLLIGLKNGILIEATIGAGIYMIVTQDMHAGLLTAGLSYLTYKSIKSAL